MKLFNIILASLIISVALCGCSNNQNSAVPITSDKVESAATSTPDATSTSTHYVTSTTKNSENSPTATANKTQEPEKSVKNIETDYLTLGFDLLRNESVGPINLSLSSEDVVKALGEPEEKSEFLVWDSDGLEHQSWIYAKEGIILEIVKTENAITVASIDISSPCTYKTSRGIGIGSKKSEVYEAYKPEIDPAENKEDSEFIVVGTVYGGIIFSIENDSVSGIFIGASAE